MTKVEYKKAIWAILQEFRDSKVMTLEEVTTRIIAVPVPEKREKGKITFDRKKKMMGW